MSEWITPHEQWQAWSAQAELYLPPVNVIDEFDHELRGVLDGMFGPALEATSVEMVKAGLREDSMTTLIRHRDDVVRPPPQPEEFDAASTLVHAPRVDGDAGGFDVAVSTPGGGFEIELQPPAAGQEDNGFFIPALTESARIVVVDSTAESQGPAQSIDGNGEPAAARHPPDVAAIEAPAMSPPLTVPTIVAEPGPLEARPSVLEDARGPIGWADPPPEPTVPAVPAVRSGTTLVPTDPPPSSSQTAGVIVSLDADDGQAPPRRKSKIVVQSEDSPPEGVAAQAYDDSGEYPRPVPPLEPAVDETELEEGDLDSADLDDDSPDGDGPPRPPAPKPAVRVATGEHPPAPPRVEPPAAPTPPLPPPAPAVSAAPPPPPRAEVPPVRDGPRSDAAPSGPPPPPLPKEAARAEGPPPPPKPALEAARPEPAPVVELPPQRTGPDAPPPPRVRTMPGVAGPHWSDSVFTEHFFALVRPGGPRIAATEVAFLQEALGLASGSTIIDVGCGDGWHAQLLAERGMRVVGLDSSEPMIRRATELAEQNGVRVRWMLGDVRQRVVDETFDAVLCLGTSFGYDDEPTNRKMMQAMRDLVRVGGRLALHVVNRDYVVPRLPARSWWQGDRCLVLDEVDMQDWSSRVRVRRTIVFEDGGQFEHALSIRAYALHELISLVEEEGLRVVEVSGSPHTRGRFYGATSPDIWMIAERIDDR